MAKPPKLKTLRPEDYDFNGDASEWGPKLLQVLSTFCGDVTNAMSGQLTAPENIRREEWEITFTTGAALSLDQSPFPLMLTPKVVTQPRHIWVTSIEDISVSGGGSPVAAVQPFWQRTSEGQVKMRFVHGLLENQTYRMRGLME